MREQLTSGLEIDGFLIGDRIHRGGMADIFRASKPGCRARLVMKIPHAASNEPGEAILSFETEATIVPTLHGAHVPRFVAAGDLAEKPYLVTEWITGESLEHFLGPGSLPLPEVTRIGAAIADAIHSLHQQEVIHLDVKPANIILKTDGTAALIDFGFAHHARYPDLLAEESRFRAGSAAYVSPEQLFGTREDPRSDIFSLGVVLYEMATGTLPFGEPDTDVRNRLWFDPLPPAVAAPGLSSSLQEIILRCLEPKADARYQSAAHVAFDLRELDQVVLTARATKARQANFFKQMKRFWVARSEYDRQLRSPAVLTKRGPIVMVALDTTHVADDQQLTIREATRQTLSLTADFRLLCVSVIRPATPMETVAFNETASGRYLEHLARLRQWAEPLGLGAHRLSLHIIESTDPARVILELAHLNNVDLMILGAPRQTEWGRPWSRSVALAVIANATGSVQLVRAQPRGSVR